MKIALVTAYKEGKPYHMKHSGYEQLIRFVKHDRLFFTMDYKPMPKYQVLLKSLKLIPPYYYSFSFEQEISGNYDVVHHLYGESTFWLSGLKDKSKQVVTIHPPVEYFRRIMPFYWRKVLDGARIITVSPSQKDFFSRELPKSKVFLIPHGVDTDYFKPKKIGKQDYILSVGDHQRDFKTLVDAFSKVSTKYPDLRLVVVSYTYQSNQHNVITKNNIPDDELLELYQGAKFQVLALHDCTANNVLLESFACRVPCIITDIEDVKYYTQGKGSLQYVKGDSDDLAQKMILMMDDRLKSKLASEAIAQSKRFSWDKIARMTEDAYG
jgi:glycosyltransferase involved in cell wall biosynthesis